MRCFRRSGSQRIQLGREVAEDSRYSRLPCNECREHQQSKGGIVVAKWIKRRNALPREQDGEACGGSANDCADRRAFPGKPQIQIGVNAASGPVREYEVLNGQCADSAGETRGGRTPDTPAPQTREASSRSAGRREVAGSLSSEQTIRGSSLKRGHTGKLPDLVQAR